MHSACNPALSLGNANNDHPQLIITDAVVDDLAAIQVGIALKHLHGGVLSRVEDIPVIDRGVGHQTQAAIVVPLPEDNILVHGGRLELGLLCQVEDLNCSALSLESQNLAIEMHDGTVGANSAFDDFIVVLEIYNYDLGPVLFIKFLSYANKVVGL